jgi:MFS family permease
MSNKKYLPAVIVLYLNYFLHGIGSAILGQAVIKDSLANSFGVQVMAITAISAALGLGRLIALPIAGPLSDKLGRRFSTFIGGLCYAAYAVGIALAFNAGGGSGYKMAYVFAIIGGIANSFLDTGIYPALAELVDKAPGVAPVRFVISNKNGKYVMPSAYITDSMLA